MHRVELDRVTISIDSLAGRVGTCRKYSAVRKDCKYILKLTSTELQENIDNYIDRHYSYTLQFTNVYAHSIMHCMTMNQA